MSELHDTLLHDTAHARLRADGQRYTTGRRALVDALDQADRPLSIPELLDGRRDLVQSSAYRNLAVLERAGVVRRIVTHDEFARYELAEDLTEHHHHLICSRCGTVDDFTVPAALEEELDRSLGKVARKHGFDSTSHRLDLVGTCARCK
jgi:Fur family transcriptional regulator, ferric uptake regulator